MQKFTISATVILLIFVGFNFLNAQTVILSEDFEGISAGSTPPAGWTRSQATPSVGFEFGVSSSLASQYFPVPANTQFACSNDDRYDNQAATQNNASEDRLITPPMDLTPFATTGIDVTFDAFNPAQYGSSGSVEVSTDGGQTWTSIGTLPASSQWASYIYGLSAYTNSTNVLVAFRHNDGGGWADGLAIDNVVVKSQPALDAELSTIQMDDYELVGAKTIRGTITNRGGDPINSIEVGYSIDGGPWEVDMLTGLNIANGNSYTFTHSKMTANLGAGLHDIDVYINDVNGGGVDASTANDSMGHTLSALTTIPPKKIILEDFTGAWCQFCPDGTVIMNNILAGNPNVIGVATHQGDDMEIPDGATQISAIGVNSYPSGAVDLVKFEDQGEIFMNRGRWTAKVAERANQIVPVSVSVSNQYYNLATRELTVEVKADFAGELVDAADSEIRLNLWVLEDKVTGVGRGYNQVNFYNTQAGHPYAGQGNPIIGFEHDHTLRAMLGGTWGEPNSVPGPVTGNYSVTKTFTYSLPVTMDETQIKLVGIAQEYGADILQRRILNADEVKLDLAVNVDPVQVVQEMIVSPNPFSDLVTISFDMTEQTSYTVAVYDVLGKNVAQLASGVATPGNHRITWDGRNGTGVNLSNGLYTIIIKTQDRSITKKVMLQR